MKYRSFGRTGVQVSAFCLGTMNFGSKTPEDESIRIMDAAFDAGINFFDTANVYGEGVSEVAVGKAIADKRDKIFLASKVYFPMGNGPNERGISRYHIMQACDDSLRRLNTDHIDLYQLHRPDLNIPVDETLRALDDLVRQGKVRYVGVSTFPAWLTVESIYVSEKLGLNRFVSEQPPYNLLDRRAENEIIPMAQRYGLAVIPWSPLGGGVLAGKYPPDQAPPAGSRLTDIDFYEDRVTMRSREVAQQIAGIAADYGLHLPQLALLWVRDQPGITSPIIGPRTMAHLETALSLSDKQLDAEAAARLDELCPPGNAVADYFNTADWMKMRITDN